MTSPTSWSLVSEVIAFRALSGYQGLTPVPILAAILLVYVSVLGL